MRSWAKFYGFDDTQQNALIETLVLMETFNGRALLRLAREKFGDKITASQIHAPILTDQAIARALDQLQPHRVRAERLPTTRPITITRVQFDPVDTSDSAVPLRFHLLDGPVIVVWPKQSWQIYPRATFRARAMIDKSDPAEPLESNPSAAARRMLQQRELAHVYHALRAGEIKSLEELNARLDAIFADKPASQPSY
jgi:hypothetical protein